MRTLFAFLLFPLIGFSQFEDLSQRIDAFKSDFSENYTLKYLNVDKQDLGNLYESFPDFEDAFKLKSSEKLPNEDGDLKTIDLYVNIFAYETKDDLNWAMKDWLKLFIADASVRPGRPSKKALGAKPSIVIVNEKNICILTMSCGDYSFHRFKEWRANMLQYFGNEESVVIEVNCDGPIQWTKNIPDPKDRTWR